MAVGDFGSGAALRLASSTLDRSHLVLSFLPPNFQNHTLFFAQLLPGHVAKDADT
jgi:hypothetical protein